MKTMPTGPLSVVIQHLLADLGPDDDGMADGELLARFQRSRDADALATLVRRHAAMVWGVCRRLLDHDDAEDAFQAAFLVLVKKAADVPGPAVANWLYGVARQTAVRLRAAAAKRGRRERQVANMPEPTAAEVRDADLQTVVDEELGRLPDHYRGVIVLCDLEGLTRREAARQLGIPEGSVASRLARARAMLAKRLTRRGVVFSAGSVAAVLSGSASASAPPALVASTITAASLLAAGQAAGVVSAKVAALTEGVVQTMLVTKIKSVLAVALVVATLASAVGMFCQTQAAEPSKDAPKKAEEKPVPAQPTPPPAKTDRERMVGNWFIMNEDSGRKGEMWVIYEDWIRMHAKDGGANSRHYWQRLDASKNPKQIDITATSVNGPVIGSMKGIYTLDGDELRLCLAAIGQDRPTAFPEKPAVGQVLILQRAASGATPPKAKEKPPAKTDQELMVGEWHVIDPKTKAPGELWVISKDQILMNYYGPGLLPIQYHFLDASKDPKQIDISFSPENGGPQAIKGLYVLDGDELRLCLGARGKDRPAAFPEKPKPGEVLILQRAKSDATARPEKKVLTPEEAIKQMPKENVTVQFKVAKVEAMPNPGTGFGGPTYYIYLHDGGKFTARLAKAADQFMKLGVDPVKHFTGKVVRVTGGVETDSGRPPFHMWVRDLADIEVVKE